MNDSKDKIALVLTEEELYEVLDSGICPTDCLEGCVVEPDGNCPHGYDSYLITHDLI